MWMQLAARSEHPDLTWETKHRTSKPDLCTSCRRPCASLSTCARTRARERSGVVWRRRHGAWYLPHLPGTSRQLSAGITRCTMSRNWWFAFPLVLIVSFGSFSRVVADASVGAEDSTLPVRHPWAELHEWFARHLWEGCELQIRIPHSRWAGRRPTGHGRARLWLAPQDAWRITLHLISWQAWRRSRNAADSSLTP